MIGIKLCDELHIQGTRYVYILLVYWLCLTNAGSSSNNVLRMRIPQNVMSVCLAQIQRFCSSLDEQKE